MDLFTLHDVQSASERRNPHKARGLAAFPSQCGKQAVKAARVYDVRLEQSVLKALNISDEVCEQIIEEAITERNLIRR